MTVSHRSADTLVHIPNQIAILEADKSVRAPVATSICLQQYKFVPH